MGLLLEDDATSLLLLLGVEDGLDGIVENILQVRLSLCRALQILDGTNLPRQFLTTSGSDGLLTRGTQLLQSSRIISQIQLGSHKKIGDIGAEVHQLRIPLSDRKKGGRNGGRFSNSEKGGEETEISPIIQNFASFRKSIFLYITYLRQNVVIRNAAHDGEADQEDLSIGIGERSQSIVLLLA